MKRKQLQLDFTTIFKVLFFTLLSACVVAALQTVGAILVIAMVITPGATAYLLTDKFKTLIKIAVALGAITGYVINGNRSGKFSHYFSNPLTMVDTVTFSKSI